VTAELAAVLPAIILVLAFGLGAMQLAGEQLRLQSAAGDAARLVGRGAGGGLAIVRQVSPDAGIDTDYRGELVCVRARAPARIGILIGITISATSCALSDGG
jgi:hypothetical protein